MNTSPTDAELIEASIGGKISAFGELIERYQNLVCSVAYSATGDRALSEDVAQETFVAAWKQLADIREPDKFRGWLCGTARNLTKMALRKGKREVLGGDDAAVGLAVTDGSALDDMLAHEREALVWSALKEVPETYREPLVLFYREEQSVRQVALGLGISEDAVKQRLARGRKSLRQSLAEMVETTLADTRPSKAFAVGVVALIAAQAGTAAAATKSAASSAGGNVAGATAAAGFSTGRIVALGVFVGAIGVVAVLWHMQSGDEVATGSAREPDSTSARHARRPTLPNRSSADFQSVEDDVDDLLDPQNPAVIVEALDLLGGPIVGAEVFERDLAVGQTDERGVLRIPTRQAQVSGIRAFRVRAHGYAQRRITFSGYGRLTVQLVPESTISGTVVSAADGAPVSGLRVISGGLEPITTDNEGRFAFDRVPPGRYELSATGPGWSGSLAKPLDVGLHFNETGVVIEVARGYAIEGRVSTRRGKLPSGLVISGGPVDVSVAAGGRFEIDGVAPGTYRLSVGVGRNNSLFSTTTVTVASANVANVEIELEPIYSVEVVATSRDGSAVAGLEFSCIQRHGTGLKSCGCTTNDEGRCHIEGLFDGEIERLRPEIPDEPARTVAVPADAPIRFSVPRFGGISGRVTTKQGVPVAWRIIEVEVEDGQSRTVFGDVKGRFQFGGLPAGRFEVSVFAYDNRSFMAYLTDRKRVPIGKTSVTLAEAELATGVHIEADYAEGKIAGRVIGPDGQPQPSALVTYVVDSPRVHHGTLPVGIETVVADNHGAFSFEHVHAAHTYKVYAQGPNGEQGRLDGVSAGGTPVSIAIKTPAELRVSR